MDISELKFPIEVWKAVEGDPSDLIALLRSEERFVRIDRDTLADWLEGTLQPMKLKKGGQEKHLSPHEEFAIRHIYFGYDPTTELGSAGIRYEIVRRFIRKKRWHLKSAGRLHWSPQKLAEVIADKHDVDLEKLLQTINRSKVKKPVPATGPKAVERMRRQIALEIRRKRMG